MQIQLYHLLKQKRILDLEAVIKHTYSVIDHSYMSLRNASYTHTLQYTV